MTAPPLVRPVLLGEAPSPGGDPNQPLGGRIGARLCRLMGWDFDDEDPFDILSVRFEPMNVFRTAEDADPWDQRVASAEWVNYLQGRARARAIPFVLVVFGRRAATAVGARDRPFFEWMNGQLYDSVILPHPSGRNRAWNDPATGARVREALATALRKAGSA